MRQRRGQNGTPAAAQPAPRTRHCARDVGSGHASGRNQQCELVLQHSTDAIIAADASGNIVSWNPAAERLFGYVAREVTGQPFVRLLPARHRHLCEAAPRAASRRAIPDAATAVDIEALHQDGREIPVRLALCIWKSNGRSRLTALVRDVSEQRMAEANHIEHTRRLRAIERVAGIGTYDLDLATGTWKGSDMLYRILGLSSRGEHTVQEWLAAVHPEWRTVMAEYFRQDVVAARGEFDREYQIVRKSDGATRWVHGRGVLTLDAEGQPTRMLGTISDITRRKSAELAELQQAAWHQAVIRAAPDGFVALDADGCILEANDAFCVMTGFAEAELIGQHVSRFVNREVAAQMGDRLRALKDGGPTRGEVDIVTKSGPFITCAISAQYEPSGRGRFVAFFHDITERRRTEATMQLRNAALEASAVPMLITDVSGCVVWANTAFTAMTGYALDETVGRRTRDLLNAGAQDDAFYDALWNTIQEGNVWQGELINRRKDGTRYPERLSITPVKNAQGVITNFIAVKQDLTAERAAQAELLHAQKMESVGRLAAGVAHDFNNLLTVILSYAKFVEEDLPPGDARRDDVRQILAAGESAAELTGRLLAFSRRQVRQPKVIQLNALITNIEQLLRRVLGEDVTLRLDLATELPPIVLDRGEAEQVLMNLAVNARDAMAAKGGTLTISTRYIPPATLGTAPARALSGSGAVALGVTDTGTGMDAATCARVFDPFFTTKPWGKGTGLGLATVRSIVQASGGHIELQSALGVGTTFTLSFPPVDATVAVGVDDASDVAPKDGTETILVVDDADAIRHAACNVLRRRGYTVLDAPDGPTALQVASQHAGPIQLLVTDIVMPGMNGRTLADQLAALKPKLKVLYMSGYTDDALAEHGVLRPNLTLLNKPFTPAPLVRMVREVLDAPS